MPKTTTIYKFYKAFRMSDLGNQMLSNMWRVNKSSSEAEFIRYTIVYFMKNEMKDVFNDFKNMSVPEINDFLKKQNGL